MLKTSEAGKTGEAGNAIVIEEQTHTICENIEIFDAAEALLLEIQNFVQVQRVLEHLTLVAEFPQVTRRHAVAESERWGEETEIR